MESKAQEVMGLISAEDLDLTEYSDALVYRINVTVETMKDRLYLFQCYPQITTTLTFAEYTDDSRTATKEVIPLEELMKHE